MFDVIENGWQAFSAETEFNRFKECQEDWRISYVNKDYKVKTGLKSIYFSFLKVMFFTLKSYKLNITI